MPRESPSRWKPNRLERFVIARAAIVETSSVLRAHGALGQEQLVFWVGPLGAQKEALVSRCVHPAQVSTAGSVDVDELANARLQLELVERGEFLWAQVHSHPGSAFHSGRDDRFPATHKPGYVSIVVPDFGHCDILTFDGCRVFEYVGGGQWHEWEREEILRRVRVEGSNNE